MRRFRIWDNVEKVYFDNNFQNDNKTVFSSIREAKNFKDDFLNGGNYPDKPHTCIQIHEFDNELFIREICSDDYDNDYIDDYDDEVIEFNNKVKNEEDMRSCNDYWDHDIDYLTTY